MNDSTKVKVTFISGESQNLTVGDIKTEFKNKPNVIRRSFLETLKKYNMAFGEKGKYEIIYEEHDN